MAFSSKFACCWRKEGLELSERGRKEEGQVVKANEVIPGKSGISNEPISESAATRAKSGQECKPESESRNQSHPDLQRSGVNLTL